MKTAVFSIIIVIVSCLNACSADTFIGHAYYFKCPYNGCDEEAIYARPLFKKAQESWQVFPNGADIDYTPDIFKQSYKLFPIEIKWNIFNNDHSLIGKEIVENKKPIEWLINTGAAQMQIDPEIIKQNINKSTNIDTSADLILSTNENIVFSKFETRKTTEIEIFESAIKNRKYAGNSIDSFGIVEKYATVYSVENMDVITILDFKQTGGDIGDTSSVVLAKVGDKWEFVFDGNSLNYYEDNVLFTLKTIADFDNDGKNEYIFNLISGFNEYGYILWQNGIAKPLVYKFYSH